MPLESPNPYSSYYDFGSVSSAIAAHTLGVQPGFDVGMQRALGQAAGFAPNSAEAVVRRTRDSANAASMSDALRSDPRGRAMTDFVMDQIYGGNAKMKNAAYDKAGGVANISEWVSSIINMPGVSGYMGGDIRSIRLGSMAATQSGMQIHSAGRGIQTMYGGGMAQDHAAKALSSAMMSRFMTSGGALNTAQSQGMNLDQLGGIMTLGAQGGAFAGLNIGKISRLNDKTAFQLNPDTVKKVGDFVAQTAKTLSGLVDVFGDRGAQELAQIAQKITGTDIFRNINAAAGIHSRISALKQTAEITGYDARTTMESAMAGTQLGQSLGLGAASAGSISMFATMRSRQDQRMGQYDRGFYHTAIDIETRKNDMIRDQAALLRDPIGVRSTLVEAAIEQGRISSKDAGAARERARNLSPDGVGDFDQYFRGVSGTSVSRLFSGYGSGAKIMESLSDAGRSNVTGMNAANMRIRSLSVIERLADKASAGNGAGLRSLVDMFDFDTLGKAAGMMDSGRGVGAITDLLLGDPALKGDRTAASRYAGIFGSLGAGNARSSIVGLSSMMGQNEIVRNFMSQSSSAKQFAMDSKIQQLGQGDVESMQGFVNNGVQGFFNRVGGTTPAARLAMLGYIRPGSVYGLKDGQMTSLRAQDYAVDGQGDLTPESAKLWQASLQNLASNSKGSVVAHRLGLSLDPRKLRDIGYTSGMFRQVTGAWSNPDARTAALLGLEAVEGANGRLIFGSKFDTRGAEEIGPLAYSVSALRVRAGGYGGTEMARKMVELAERYIRSGASDEISTKRLREGLVVQSGLFTGDDLRGIAKNDPATAKLILSEMVREQTKLDSMKGDTFTTAGRDTSRFRELGAHIKALKDAGIDDGTQGVGKYLGVLSLQGPDGAQLKLYENR